MPDKNGTRMEKALLIDSFKCTACRGCMVACKQWNHLPAESTGLSGSYENPPSLSPSTLTRILFQEIGTGEDLKWIFRKEQCLHCSQAACLALCPSNAIFQNRYGFVEVKAERCIGCGICQKFCPFKIARVNQRTHKAVKCTFCVDRIEQGLTPACVKTCPTGALRFGDRQRVLIQARQATADSKNGPRYLYGDRECGGLHVLYLLPEPPSTLGLPENPRIPNPFEAYAFLKDCSWPSSLRDKVLALAEEKYFRHRRG